MSLLKPSRPARISLLLLVLLFGLLLAVCWFWYDNQLRELDRQLRQRQQQVEKMP